MSICTQAQIIDRVMDGESPIALFKGSRIGESGKVDCVFADTVLTARKIEAYDTSFLMQIHKSLGRDTVEAMVRNAFDMSRGGYL